MFGMEGINEYSGGDSIEFPTSLYCGDSRDSPCWRCFSVVNESFCQGCQNNQIGLLIFFLLLH